MFKIVIIVGTNCGDTVNRKVAKVTNAALNQFASLFAQLSFIHEAAR